MRKETVMENYEWMKFYQEAVLETDSGALPFRIAAAQNAIGQRVIRVAVDDAERKAIVATLNALAVLRRERCPVARAAHN
jgi:hypothetical protein